MLILYEKPNTSEIGEENQILGSQTVMGWGKTGSLTKILREGLGVLGISGTEPFTLKEMEIRDIREVGNALFCTMRIIRHPYSLHQYFSKLIRFVIIPSSEIVHGFQRNFAVIASTRIF